MEWIRAGHVGIFQGELDVSLESVGPRRVEV